MSRPGCGKVCTSPPASAPTSLLSCLGTGPVGCGAVLRELGPISSSSRSQSRCSGGRAAARRCLREASRRGHPPTVSGALRTEVCAVAAVLRYSATFMTEVTKSYTLFPCRSFQGTEAVRGKSTHRAASGPVLTAWRGRVHLRPRPPSSPPTSGPLPQPAAVLRPGQWPGAPMPRAGAGLGDLTLGLGVLPLLTWSLLP